MKTDEVFGQDNGEFGTTDEVDKANKSVRHNRGRVEFTFERFHSP